MKQIKYGVMSCGAIAQRRHLPELAANPKARVVAVTDARAPRAEEVGGQYGATAYTDYRRMLKQEDLDAVVVCSPNYLHAPMSIAALKAGLHVLCEKPMATTRRDAKAMIKAAGEARKYLMVAMNQRFMPAHVKAKAILEAGKIGKPVGFRTSFKHPGPDGWSVDGARSWFFDKDAAVMGATGDLGVHKADLMRWLLGEEFAEVSGIVTTVDKRGRDGKLLALDDNAIITLKSKRGVVGSVEVSWTNYGGEDNATLIYCTNGVIYLGTDPQYGVVVIYRDHTRELHQVGAMSTNLKQVSSGVSDCFTDCILKKRKPSVDGREGYKSLDLILTAMEAAKARKTLKIGS